jgi:hypothetical protein
MEDEAPCVLIGNEIGYTEVTVMPMLCFDEDLRVGVGVGA